MIYQAVVAFLLAVFLLNLALNLLDLPVPRGRKLPEPAPLVSVIVPARDEEKNIGRCLDSLLGQDYPALEIIVLDDNSTDATTEAVAALAEGDSRLRLVKGGPLPAGWAGKPWACHQAAQSAKGGWLLFVDADTVASPDMLRRVIPEAVAWGAAMLSGFPRQITSFGQKTAIPMMYFFVLSWFPLWWLRRSRKPLPTLAIGQFLLFEAGAYHAMGGHEAVKSRIIEDIWLGVEVTRRGGRQVSVDLSPVFATRMYDTFGAMWEGLVKWTYSVAALSLLALMALIALAFAVFLLPLEEMVRLALAGGGALLPLVVFQVAVVFLMRWLVDVRFRESNLATILHPVGMIVWISAALWGAARQVTGAGVSWKRRFYDRTSAVD
jgi:chlorobactene glucosyltransferase